jgi:hypothetical protein
VVRTERRPGSGRSMLVGVTPRVVRTERRPGSGRSMLVGVTPRVVRTERRPGSGRSMLVGVTPRVVRTERRPGSGRSMLVGERRPGGLMDESARARVAARVRRKPRRLERVHDLLGRPAHRDQRRSHRERVAAELWRRGGLHVLPSRGQRDPWARPRLGGGEPRRRSGAWGCFAAFGGHCGGEACHPLELARAKDVTPPTDAVGASHGDQTTPAAPRARARRSRGRGSRGPRGGA